MKRTFRKLAIDVELELRRAARQQRAQLPLEKIANWFRHSLREAQLSLDWIVLGESLLAHARPYSRPSSRKEVTNQELRLCPRRAVYTRISSTGPRRLPLELMGRLTGTRSYAKRPKILRVCSV